MLIPVRCFTCNKVIGGYYEEFYERVEKERAEKGHKAAEAMAVKVMDEKGIARYCCRRIYMAHTDLIDDVLPYD